jgi:hypothetical protein
MSTSDNFVTVSKRIGEVQFGNDNRRYIFYRLLVTYIHYDERQAFVRQRKKKTNRRKRKKQNFCFVRRSNMKTADFLPVLSACVDSFSHIFR